MTPLMRGFDGPSALDLLTEFKRVYLPLAEKRIAELKKTITENPTPESALAYDELDSLRYLEPTLHRMIQAFVLEAVTPLNKILSDAIAQSPWRP